MFFPLSFKIWGSIIGKKSFKFMGKQQILSFFLLVNCLKVCFASEIPIDFNTDYNLIIGIDFATT